MRYGPRKARYGVHVFIDVSHNCVTCAWAPHTSPSTEARRAKLFCFYAKWKPRSDKGLLFFGFDNVTDPGEVWCPAVLVNTDLFLATLKFEVK